LALYALTTLLDDQPMTAVQLADALGLSRADVERERVWADVADCC